MPYTKTVWDDEVLAGAARYNILDNGGTPIESNVQINLNTSVATAGTPVTASAMNNIEDWIETADEVLSSMNDSATQLTIASGVITVTQSNHKLQPETGTADDLVTINGTTAGQSGVFYAADFGTDTITLKHGTGNIECFGAADISLSTGFVPWFSNGTKVFILSGGGGVTDAELLALAGLTSAANKIPMFSGSGTATLLDLDTNTALGTSDTKVPSQKAVKNYVDTNATSKVVNYDYLQDGEEAHGTGTYTSNDTKPTTSGGNQFMSKTYTPASATNKLKIEVVVFVTASVAGYIFAGLFQDSITDTLGGGFEYNAGGGTNVNIKFTHWMAAGTTSLITFKVRAGNSAAGTTTFNGYTSARKYGGILASSITITELLP